MRSEKEIRDEIEKINRAIEDSGYEPVPDYTRLEEHKYHQRVSAVTFLRWVLNEVD